MGPQGIGGICIRKGVEIRPLKTGGTGILSFSKTQPEVLPRALEAGTWKWDRNRRTWSSD